MYFGPMPIIIVISFILAVIAYDGKVLSSIKDKNFPWTWHLIEILNQFITYFIGGLIGYYFILVRWNQIFDGGDLFWSDFILFLIFSMCLFRYFPYFLKNITKGISAIISRVIKK
jgi:hypothetical protein